MQLIGGETGRAQARLHLVPDHRDLLTPEDAIEQDRIIVAGEGGHRWLPGRSRTQRFKAPLRTVCLVHRPAAYA
ncbi:hypothetical protein GCM10012284_35740 [Mangrovihabitans endophyticus]|uniref:Uncharacterized protein n=1 Tax=Mangrovihabitans endophyticus TaxID=1751298 RepID=A0A8J3C254_9ACTN|nr:hypothetical protein GCM10012284_35740 [Mangrovihabitans endophyticus]